MFTRNRIVLSFYIKRTKLLKNGTAPIYLRIKVNSGSAELAVMRNLRPELWSTEKNGALGISNEAREINNYMHHVRKQVEEHIAAMRDDGVELTARKYTNQSGYQLLFARSCCHEGAKAQKTGVLAA